MPYPIDKELYDYVKKLASKKFKSPSGIYRSSWIVRKYKSMGGKYRGRKNSASGLKRWYRENWIDLNSPIKSNTKIIGYRSCGRTRNINGKYSRKYPLCRPSKRINSRTPKTYKMLSKKSIRSAKKYKSKYKYKRNVYFS